jgi:hypothetical protein
MKTTDFISNVRGHNQRRINPGLHCMVFFGLLAMMACVPEPIVDDNSSQQNNTSRPIAIINRIGLTITYPANKTILDGTLSSDPAGIKSYKWILVSGQANGNPSIENPDTAITTISGLKTGSFVVQLTVVNRKGIESSTIERIEVLPNQMPFAFAGDHQVILPNETVELNGSSSTDDNMSAIRFAWTQVAGPSIANIKEPNSMKTSVSHLVLGTYSFELRVVDDANQVSTDTVHVAVRNPGEIEKTQVVIKDNDFGCPWGCGTAIENYKSYLPPGKKLLQVYVRSTGTTAWEMAKRYTDNAWNLTSLFYQIYNESIFIETLNETRFTSKVDVKLVYF